MTIKYYVFGYDEYYPDGGFRDYLGVIHADDKEQVKTIVLQSENFKFIDVYTQEELGEAVERDHAEVMLERQKQWYPWLFE